MARRLEEKLDDDNLLWYNVPIGEKRRHPDFIVLHPLQGLLVLEVKDWKLENIQSVTSQSVELLTSSGVKSVQNPLQQARDHALAIHELLEQDPVLLQCDGQHKGKLIMPYGYGVVLSNITRKSFDAIPALGDAIASHLVICKDEFIEAVDPGDFQEQLWAMSPYAFGIELNQGQIDRVRWHLFPELRITAKQLELLGLTSEPEPEAATQPLDIVQILDLQQEQLARSLGDGHRVVHGVAGSGKTLILAYRAQYLAESTQKPVLVLCFNVSLAAHLESMIRARGDASQPVLVRHFHGWCKDLLQTYRIGLPDRSRYSGSDYIEQLVERVTNAIASGQIPSGLYGAVMIDEGHDFEAAWLQLAAQIVSPETNSLLLLYDDAQSLYGKQQRQKFSFKSVGIQAQGRTTILKVNYRNPSEVLTLAYSFIQQAKPPSESDANNGGDLPQEDRPRLKPQTAGRGGATPELVMLPSFGREAVYLAERVQQLHERGTTWSDIAIVYRTKFMGEVLHRQLTQAGVPVEWLNKDSRSRFYHPDADSVKLLTMHSSKGLEFEAVCIPGIGYMPYSHGEPESEMRLFYVAMTRATERLLLTAHRDSEFVQRVEAGLQLMV